MATWHHDTEMAIYMASFATTGKSVETLPAIVALSPSPDEGFNEDTLHSLASKGRCHVFSCWYIGTTFQHISTHSSSIMFHLVSMSFHKFILLTGLSLSREKIRTSLYYPLLALLGFFNRAKFDQRSSAAATVFSSEFTSWGVGFLMVLMVLMVPGCTRSHTELSFCSESSRKELYMNRSLAVRAWDAEISTRKPC